MLTREYLEYNIEKLPDFPGCWLWNNPNDLDKDGYPRINHDRVNRESFRIFKGPIEDLFVLHRCDVPSCINPDHLFLDTQKDNIRDCISKGRRNKSSTLGYRKAVCLRGHDRTPENLNGSRDCLQCVKIRNAKR